MESINWIPEKWDIDRLEQSSNFCGDGFFLRSDAIPMLFGHTLPSLLFGLYIVTDVFWCFDFHDFWLVFMIFQGVFMVFHGFWLFSGWQNLAALRRGQKWS